MYKRVECKNGSLCCEDCLELLNALSDPTRQQILKVVALQKEICANDVAGNFNLTRPTISHHLNLMRRVKLLNSRKEGKEIFYSFNKEYVVKVLESFLNDLRKCC